MNGIVAEVEVDGWEGEEGVGLEDGDLVVGEAEVSDGGVEVGVEHLRREALETVPLQVHIAQPPVRVERVVTGISKEIRK